ncbi:LysR family transcriptional regulator [Breoghania sp. L-A4]|uniref:LysR family transcriptional regulator n=1 Tax=Breoghania sp. L-A4 TaxID=2304600 RepID=UPI0013C2CDE2|nr:LysR family transcriptional regulator [Breoghania sp. L-A4]
MELHQVRYFLKSCETLNFTRAAEALGVAVPTLTRAIKKLEDELGGQLFRRERHLTHLTDLGRLMHQHLSAAEAATARAVEAAAHYTRAETRLKMGIVSSMPARHLVAYLRLLRQAAPDLELHIWESHCEELGDALLGNEIDVAIMSLPDYPERLRAEPLFREYYQIAFAPGHRFQAMKAVPLRELEGEAYIKRLHCEFPSNFARLEIARPYNSVRVSYMSEREDWVQSMVAAELGCTIMPEFLPMLDTIEARPIIEPEVYRTLSIVTVAGRRHSPPVASAVRQARAMDWEAVAPQAVRREA